jgi:glycosyltransferase involved in cell wall biosynthesis
MIVSLIVIVSILLTFFYCLLILFYKISWGGIQTFTSEKTINHTKVSIIVAARNEEKNIVRLMECVTKQNYPRHLWEMIIIDDHSTDQTAVLIENQKEENIKLISLRNHLDERLVNSFKKKAIALGIKACSGELIVATDADCQMNENWLTTIVNCYETFHHKMMVMPVVMSGKNNFLGNFQVLDFMSLQGITGAAVNNNFHGMCNGANLAYSKKVFEEVGGFEGIDQIASGDDMLLMHKIAQKYPDGIFYLKSKDVIVTTTTEEEGRNFLNQRIRWASKANRYKDKKLFGVLLMVYLFNAVLIICFLVGLYFSFIKNSLFPFKNNRLLILAIGLVIVKTWVELFFLWPVADFFGKKKKLWYFPMLQPFHIVYIVMAGCLGQIGTYQWKGRKVK